MLAQEKEIWIFPQDQNGNPINPVLLEAAHALMPSFLRYRHMQVQDKSVVAVIAQRAVNGANRCGIGTRPDDNVAGYLQVSFRRKLDRFLSKALRESCYETPVLEWMANPERGRRDGLYGIEVQILLSQILALMDEKTRTITRLRQAGFSTKEIALVFGESVNCVLVRESRGLAETRIRLAKAGPRRQTYTGKRPYGAIALQCGIHEE